MARSKPRHGEHRGSGSPTGRRTLVGWRGGLLAVLWWVISGGDVASWIVGVPCVLLAVLASRTLSPHSHASVRPLGLAAFLPLFVRRTVRGSIDVAWHALHPRMPIDPDLVDYDLRFPAGPGRLLLVSVVNLLPGTVCAEIEGDRLRIHVIDRKQAVDAQLEALERRVAAVFAGSPGDRA